MIRAYQSEDQSALLEVWYRAATIAHHFLPTVSFEQERMAIVTQYLPITETWIYEHQGQVVGFIALLEQTVGGFFVEPSMEGQGVGRALMNHAVWLKGHLAVDVFAQNSIGRQFYDHYGFVVTGYSRHAELGEMLVHMLYVDCSQALGR